MIFVTGGAGYIGSHTCVELLQAGLDVAVFDNFCNSQPESLLRVQRITGRTLRVIEGDIRDRAALEAALKNSGATAVVHFAGLKAVGESVEQPLAYYDNNVLGTLRLLEAMGSCGVKSLVFSSSATARAAEIRSAKRRSLMPSSPSYSPRLRMSWHFASTRQSLGNR